MHTARHRLFMWEGARLLVANLRTCTGARLCLAHWPETHAAVPATERTCLSTIICYSIPWSDLRATTHSVFPYCFSILASTATIRLTTGVLSARSARPAR